jgi:uncharacterized protein
VFRTTSERRGSTRLLAGHLRSRWTGPAFYQGNGIILALWGREKLGPELGIPDDGARFSGIALAHNVRSREEVQEVIEQARENGAEITREPEVTFYGGYAGAFCDLDGHEWEIAHNPGFGLDDDGNIVLP